jgi:hypothetical protein
MKPITRDVFKKKWERPSGPKVARHAKWRKAMMQKPETELIELIPSPADQNPCAHSRKPMDMMVQG